MTVLLALVGGLVFGVGLTVSQMVDPGKVLSFLDIAGIVHGTWDPSLAFVMGGALAVSAPAYFYAQRRGQAALGPLRLPVRRPLDKRLTVGAVVFGIGWGLVGFCPGPAVAALGFGTGKAIVFFAAMLGGMAVYEVLASPRSGGISAADQAA